MSALITIAPVIYGQYRRKDGSYVVKVRVTFRRQSKYITTNIVALPAQLTKKLEVKDSALKDKIDIVIVRMRSAANSIDMCELDSAGVDYVVQKIQQIIRDEDYVFTLDFFEYGARVASEKPKNSQTNYMCAIHSLSDYMGVKSADITAISSSLMRGYEQYLRKTYGNNARAVSLYTSAIAYIHRRAQQEYNNEETGEIYIPNPFAYYKCPKQAPSKHRNVDKAVIQKMISMRQELSGRERLGVDIFLLSFGLMGMNTPDLYSCRAPKNGVIMYERTKTRERRSDNAEMQVQIDKHIQKLYGEYIDSTRKRAFSFHLHYCNYKNLGRAANVGLSEFKARIKLNTDITVYSARHAWASIAYSIGVDKTIINDCLCHVDQGMRTTDIYVERDWSVLWKANAKVLSKFKWD